jgi:hypothetical protein
MDQQALNINIGGDNTMSTKKCVHKKEGNEEEDS